MHRSLFRRRAALICALLGLPGLAAAQTQPWSSDWTRVEASALLFSYIGWGLAAPQGPIVGTPDGELILRTPSPGKFDDQIVRLDAQGAVRWCVNLGGLGSIEDDAELVPMLASTDGGAYVAVQGGLAVARIDGSGHVLWSSAAYPFALALDGSALIVQGPTHVEAFDTATGRLLWQRIVPALPGVGGSAGGLAVDETGAIYAAFSLSGYGSGAPDQSLVVAYDAAGRLVWQYTVPSADASKLVGAANGLVYVTGDPQSSSFSGTLALHAESGLPAWSVAAARPLGLAGAPREVIAQSATGVQRLAAQNGAPRWNATGNQSSSPFVAYDGGVSGNKAIVGITQFDVDSGALDWTASLPNSDADGNTLTLIAAVHLANGDVLFGLTPQPDIGGPPLLQSVDGSTGAPNGASAPPATAQAVWGYTTVSADGHTVVDVATQLTGSGFEFGLRALDASDGNVRWEKRVVPQPIERLDENGVGQVIAGDAAVVTFNANQTYPAGGVGGIWLGAFDLATGNQRWTALLERIDETAYQSRTGSSGPLSDADGNVIVAYGAYYGLQQPSPPYYCTFEFASSVVKLSAADGSVLWRHDETFPCSGLGYAFPPALSVIGNDVYVAGPFAAPHDQDSWLKLSGTDGSVLWASNVFYHPVSNGSYGEVYAAGDGKVIALGGGGWAELDAQTGATVWSNVDNFTCVDNCSTSGGEALAPNGDVYLAGENNSRPAILLLPAQQGADVQQFQFDVADSHAQNAYADTLNRAADGTLWTRIVRGYPYSQRAVYLAQFDPITHTLLRQQPLYLSGREVLLDYDEMIPQTAPVGERALMETHRHSAPQPDTLGAALVDTTVTANGNLSLQFSADHVATPGRSVAFILHVAYRGDAAISGVRLLADFPWLGHAQYACDTHSASNCVLDGRTGSVVATFDIEPGGSVDVSGLFLASAASDPATLSAVVAGPIGLNELDPTDNAALALVNQSIFNDGFE